MPQERLIALDTETTGLDPYRQKHRPFLCQVYDGKKVTITKDIQSLKWLLENPAVAKVGANIKFDIKMLRTIGINVQGQLYDVLIEAHLLDENKYQHASLKGLAREVLGLETKGEKSLETWFQENKILKANRSYDKVPNSIMEEYAKEDVLFTWKLHTQFAPELKKQELWDLYINECKLIYVLADMEETGVLIDVKLAKSLEIDLTQKIGLIEKKVQKKYKDLNTRSPLQLGQIFKKEVPEQHLIKKEKTLSICTDNGALESYKKYSKLAETLVQLRNFYKLRDTYCIAFCNLVDENNMLHGHFNQCGTITGRFSSSNPSLQVIPRTDDTKSPEAKQIRALFKIRPGFTNVYLDYAQIEYRMYAEYAEDEDLIKKINNGEDVHLIQACRIYGKTKDQISKQERWNAKITNFSVLYGASQKRIMEELDLEPTQAMMVIRNFYKENPKIKHLKYQLEKVIGIRGYFFNKFGRRRRMHLNESYKAINSLLQGVSADIIKVAMVKVAEILKGKKSHLELSVHDELVIALADTEKDLLPKIKNAMEDFGDKFKVKIETDIKTSKTNWAEKK